MGGGLSPHYQMYWVLGEDGVPRRPENDDEALFAFEDKRRISAQVRIGRYLVSTVFLVIDHAFGSSKPVLFETMMFEDERDIERRRYSTRTEALAGHDEMVKIAWRKHVGSAWMDEYERAIACAG